ncbi:MAG: DegT/DnrJ/EryC1/StrS family aminotransferase [Victivallaceae bacterium]|nr:DegT/DnrJ/EryC1/StrS family aminotransferase [Victivallaceae bacterium]
MEFRDLKTQYQKLRNDIDAGIADVINSSHYISGPQVAELEKNLAAYTKRTHCISCANGTDALEIALRAMNVKKGDAVFVPSFTFMSTAEVVSLLDAHPVFVDIDLTTFNMDPDSLKNAIERVTHDGIWTPKVVIPVDIFGLPADFDKILPIATQYGLNVLEDGAQGFGGKIREKMACSFGDISTTSFFPAKPLGCYGDGGAIFTDNDEWAALITSICVHGKGHEKYENIRIGRNSRLDTIQAAILLPKLRAFAQYEVAEVNRVAAHYSSRLKNRYRIPTVPEGCLSSWAQYTILCESSAIRSKLQASLKEQGIPSMIYYPRGLHQQQAFAALDYKSLDLPNTATACERVLSLPMHPYMTADNIDFVCDALLK